MKGLFWNIIFTVVDCLDILSVKLYWWRIRTRRAYLVRKRARLLRGKRHRRYSAMRK